MEPTTATIQELINNYQLKEAFEAIDQRGWKHPDLGRLRKEFKSGTFRYDPDFSDRLTLVIKDFEKEEEKVNKKVVVPSSKVDQYIAYLESRIKSLQNHRGIDEEPTTKDISIIDDAGFEKIIGEKNNLKSISWLLKGLKASKSVCRVVRSDGEKGTGFVVAGGYLITNAHVIPNATWASKAKIEFNYEEDIEGNKQSITTYFLDESDFVSSSQFDFDYARIKIKDNPEKPLNQWGSLEIDTFSDPKKGDSVMIIQHPEGGIKQIALDDNDVLSVWNQYLFYETDTEVGSSGSPVFNNDWKVVALHHYGKTLEEGGLQINAAGDMKAANRGILFKEIMKDLNAKLNPQQP